MKKGESYTTFKAYVIPGAVIEDVPHNKLMRTWIGCRLLVGDTDDGSIGILGVWGKKYKRFNWLRGGVRFKSKEDFIDAISKLVGISPYDNFDTPEERKEATDYGNVMTKLKKFTSEEKLKLGIGWINIRQIEKKYSRSFIDYIGYAVK